ncbi:hypothetical protein EV356DRAFT_566169 [Viridothelium virens]|uniref:Uncharacterized protein n=1 Tax=Viridothelium virens TaxID=1048519 RepID=A0A6A6HBQ7_VIRVR|nr:hypothetical protein EV356DRAFT_566169 [Viridothelium virens]
MALIHIGFFVFLVSLFTSHHCERVSKQIYESGRPIPSTPYDFMENVAPYVVDAISSHYTLAQWAFAIHLVSALYIAEQLCQLGYHFATLVPRGLPSPIIFYAAETCQQLPYTAEKVRRADSVLLAAAFHETSSDCTRKVVRYIKLTSVAFCSHFETVIYQLVPPHLRDEAALGLQRPGYSSETSILPEPTTNRSGGSKKLF